MTLPADRPLAGCRILLTRDSGRAAHLVERLREVGAEVDARSVIALVSTDQRQALVDAVRNLSRYDRILFTSSNGVDFFLRAVQEHRAGAALRNARFAAIGPATADRLRGYGHEVNVVADESDSEGFARCLAEIVVPGEQLLLVRPDKGSDRIQRTLAQSGVRCSAVSFYRNVASAEAPSIAQAVTDGAYDVAVLTSPSSLSRLLEVHASAPSKAVELRGALSETRLVAIGKTTAAAILDEGLKVAAVAVRPDNEAIFDAVMGLFAA